MTDASPILAIDPGCDQSAWLAYAPDARRPVGFGKIDNAELLRGILARQGVPNPVHAAFGLAEHMVIEQVASMGMAVGADVFETVFWSGLFAQGWACRGGSYSRLKRMEVKMHLCHHSRAKDPNIRQALIDLFGPGKDKAIGKKHAPGPLYGISQDVWSALAVAVTYANRHLPIGARGEGVVMT